MSSCYGKAFLQSNSGCVKRTVDTTFDGPTSASWCAIGICRTMKYIWKKIKYRRHSNAEPHCRWCQSHMRICEGVKEVFVIVFLHPHLKIANNFDGEWVIEWILFGETFLILILAKFLSTFDKTFLFGFNNFPCFFLQKTSEHYSFIQPRYKIKVYIKVSPGIMGGFKYKNCEIHLVVKYLCKSSGLAPENPNRWHCRSRSMGPPATSVYPTRTQSFSSLADPFLGGTSLNLRPLRHSLSTQVRFMSGRQERHRFGEMRLLPTSSFRPTSPLPNAANKSLEPYLHLM